MHQPLALFLFGASFTTTDASVLPRQGMTTPPSAVVTSSSSFNWWPYPPGGVTSSTPIALSAPAPALPPTPTLFTGSTPSTTDAASTSTLSSSTSSPSTTSTESIIQVTALTSIPDSAPSFGPSTPYRAHHVPFNNLWLIPICVVVGAALGYALGWACLRLWERHKRTNAETESYTWACQKDKEYYTDGAHGSEKDPVLAAEHGEASAKLGIGPVRMPSHASTSGARTWVARAQARKRSGPAMRLTDASRERGWGHVRDEEEDIAASPLLGTASMTEEPHQVSDPGLAIVPTSPGTSPYPYGDEDKDEENAFYEPVRHKSVRQRIWERLGFTEADAPGRATWNGRENERATPHIGRRASMWGRTKSTKKKVERVEQWVQKVVEDGAGEPAMSEVENSLLQQAESHLELKQLRSVSPVHDSPKKCSQVGLDMNLPETLGIHAMQSGLRSSLRTEVTLPSPYVRDAGSRSVQTRAMQQRSLRMPEGRSWGVSLGDYGALGDVKLTPKPGSKKLPALPKGGSILRSSPSAKSSSSRKAVGHPSPVPTTPSSVSRYSATPRTPAPPKSGTRTPRSSSVRPPQELHPPVPTTTPPFHFHGGTPTSRGIGTHATAAPVTKPASIQKPCSHLPPGPPLLMSPPLQSELSFQDSAPTTRKSTVSSGIAPTKPSALRASLQAHTRRSTTSKSSPPNLLASGGTTSPLSLSRPTSPKERYLARKGANARVDTILSRSYSSRDLSEGVSSPYMFGAVIDEHVEEFYAEGDPPEVGSISEGIEQRLARLKTGGK